ncbi:DUF5702 domain-containing protein [Fusicatenibacter saccharivorans]|nr:Uncharacterised protein [Fusicatenibacter saccharivorans]
MRETERQKRWAAGSITAYLCLVLILMLSLISGTIASVRNAHARVMTACAMEQGLYSLFAGYDRTLLGQYELFFYNGGDKSGVWKPETMSRKVAETAGEVLSPTASGMGILSGSLSGGQVTEVYLGGYRLATDEEGSAFSRQICEAMKASLGTYGIQQLSQKLRGEQETVKRQEDGQSGYEEEEVLKQYEESKQPEEGTEKTEGEGESGNGTPSEPDQKQPVPEDFVNPIEVIQKVMKMGILGLVLPEGQCQVEYVLCGKNSDQDNLAGTVNRLLALREAANLVYLAKDAQKQGEMEAMAGVIAASFGVPAAMPVVKMALAVCWAFAESILDLRELLDGGKVALFKTAESWQLSLEQLPKLLETGDQSRKNAPGGMEYSDYLRLLLMQKSGKAVTFGAMDLVEYNMRTEQQQPGFRLDCCVDELEAGFTAVIGKREYEITRNYGYEMQGAA